MRQVAPVGTWVLRVRLEHTFMSVVVAVQAPSKDYKLEDKERLNYKFDSVIGRYHAGDTLVILGNFNADFGSEGQDTN